MTGVTFERAMRGLRESAGLSHGEHIAVVRVGGPDAFEVSEYASTRRLYLREGQLRHTLLLDPDAGVFADVYIGSGDDGLYLLAEGPTEAELLTWLAALTERRFPSARITSRGLANEVVVLGVDGPYAWEVVSSVLGPAVRGMPYLTILRRDEVLCVRAGKTGEYGYLLLVPRSEAAALEARLLEAGRPMDLADVGLDALDACALENGHFTIRTRRDTPLAAPLTPLELQLQWRVAYDKDFCGVEALRARRAEGFKVRTTGFTADGSLAPGTPLRLGAEDAGEVLAAHFSPSLGMWVGSALLHRRLAHPHVPLTATSEAGAVCVMTRTTPLVYNASLRIDLHKHSYATRGALPVRQGTAG